jgi:hypothetical protein
MGVSTTAVGSVSGAGEQDARTVSNASSPTASIHHSLRQKFAIL